MSQITEVGASQIGAEALRIAVEPRRLQILGLIWDRERSVNEIAAQLPVSVAAVSQHLAKLRVAGLVAVRASGRQRFYRATREDIGALAVLLESFWTDRLGTLKEFAESSDRTTPSLTPSLAESPAEALPSRAFTPSTEDL
jgi:DNA-binding transcriptional ArsR family regulator